MNINSRTSKINFTGYASGEIASFTGLREAPVKIRSYINAIQEGSGDPAPDNIRPINGRNSVNITANSVDNVISLGDTYYGGSLDVTNGVLTVDKGKITIDGVNTKLTGVFGATINGYAVYRMISGYNRIGLDSAFSDTFKVSNLAYASMPVFSFVGNSGANGVCTFILPSSITSKDEADAWFAENPTTVVYKLATPIIVQLTPTEISQIIGSNSIYSDSGNVEVYYVTI